MHEKQLLFSFEEKYPFLYEMQVDGVPLYTCFRDDVLRILQEGPSTVRESSGGEKGRIFPKRILRTFAGLIKNSKKKALVFTSSIYRRDHGRNLAAEYLLERYPDSVVFEWPSRNEAYDSAYFQDANRNKYVPLDGCAVLMKAYRKICKKKESLLEDDARNQLITLFSEAPDPANENERAAIEMLKVMLPASCAQTQLSHELFRWMFKGYKSIETAVDFWGGARENIIPVLCGNPQSVELQHGLINHFHPGYVYPGFVKNTPTDFFKRDILVYGEGTKSILCAESIFLDNHVEVVGNPRVRGYKEVMGGTKQQKNMILFASQTYEVDGTGTHYYDTVIPILKRVSEILKRPEWEGYQLGIKLHPRESNTAVERYKNEVPDAVVFDNTSQLFDLLSNTYLQLTVSSTTLFEAAEFDAPTLAVAYKGIKAEDIFGFKVDVINSEDDCELLMKKMKNAGCYAEYLEYIQVNAKRVL